MSTIDEEEEIAEEEEEGFLATSDTEGSTVGLVAEDDGMDGNEDGTKETSGGFMEEGAFSDDGNNDEETGLDGGGSIEDGTITPLSLGDDPEEEEETPASQGEEEILEEPLEEEEEEEMEEVVPEPPPLPIKSVSSVKSIISKPAVAPLAIVPVVKPSSSTSKARGLSGTIEGKRMAPPEPDRNTRSLVTTLGTTPAASLPRRNKPDTRSMEGFGEAEGGNTTGFGFDRHMLVDFLKHLDFTFEFLKGEVKEENSIV